MRVLRISHSAAIAAWRGRERALRRRGDDVALITARRWHAGGVWIDADAGADENVTPARTFGTHPALFVYEPGPLWRALGEKWDVIDIHEEPFALSTAEVLVMRMLRRNPAPVVLYTAQNLHKRYPAPFRWLERWALGCAAGISACNTAAARITEAKGFAGRARVIPLGVDAVAGLVPTAADATRADAADRYVTVGMLGRLVPEKGIATLLDALVLAPGLHARIGGSGPLGHALADWAAERGVADRVEVIGAVDPAHVEEFYRSVDVLAVPSVPRDGWTEQFGRVAVEAMAMDVPVVSSDAGALPDVVGGAGIVVPAGDAAALATALMEAAGPRREELVESGRVRAAECSWDNVAAAYQELYRSVVRGEPSASTAAIPEIVVVAYGAPQMLRRALEPVAALPVTVIDNSSLPEIAALCAELGVRYRDPGANLGFGAAVNLALSDRLFPGADLLLLNPDAEIDRAGIEKLQRALRADPSLASVGPAQVDGEGLHARVEWPFPAPHRAVMDALGLGRFERGARFVIGSVLLLRAEALAQVGGFDERFFLYAEETDWAYRAHRLGWRHHAVGDVTARHLAGGTSTDPRRREAYFFGSQERYFRKHFGVAGWAVARASGWAGALVRSAVLRGERRTQARRRAAIYRLGPVRVEGRFRPRAAGAHNATVAHEAAGAHKATP